MAPLKVLLVSEGLGGAPDGGSYLEMLLRLHGRFQITRDGDDGHDAVLLTTDANPRLREAPGASQVPVIVVPRWHADHDEVAAMVEDGAEDVIPLSEVSAARLESAVRKAMGRRNRMPSLRVPLREALTAPANPPAPKQSPIWGWAAPQTGQTLLEA